MTIELESLVNCHRAMLAAKSWNKRAYQAQDCTSRALAMTFARREVKWARFWFQHYRRERAYQMRLARTS